MMVGAQTLTSRKTCATAGGVPVPLKDSAAGVNRQLGISFHDSGWPGFGNSFGRQNGVNDERLAEEMGYRCRQVLLGGQAWMPSAGGDGILIWGPSGTQSHRAGSPPRYERLCPDIPDVEDFARIE